MSKTAIITGGSRGLGAAMTMKLGELGYNVVINYRSESSKALTDEAVEKLKSEYGVDAIAATIPLGKIGDPSDIAGALEYIIKAPYVTGQVISPNGGFVLQ